MSLKLAVNASHMASNGTRGHGKTAGDLTIITALRQQMQDVSFAWSEPFKRSEPSASRLGSPGLTSLARQANNTGPIGWRNQLVSPRETAYRLDDRINRHRLVEHDGSSQLEGTSSL
jgi:hypothetical protein